MRLDVLLTEKKLAKSRTAGATLIRQGVVLINGKQATKPSLDVSPDAVISITEQLPYVSRSGIKLEHALEYFHIEVQGKTAIDIGSSTGGFTDCLLQKGIKKVYAVDVGTDQLDSTIRNNPKVIVMEQTDIREASFPELVDLVVVDVSFISLSHILQKVYTVLKSQGQAIILIKPQFEVGKEYVGKKGIVSDAQAVTHAHERILQQAKELRFTTHEIITSPITGSTGNIEYLTLLSK